MLQTKIGLLKSLNNDRINTLKIYEKSKIYGEEKTSTYELKK